MNVENRVINVRVDGSYVTKDSRLAGVQGEGNVTTMRFTFGDSWDGYSKKVTFTNAKGENQTTIELLLTIDDDETNNNIYECKIPGEALTEPGECTFFVEGVRAPAGEQVSRQRSEDETLFVLPGSDGEYDPAATELEQIEWYLEHKVEPIMLDAEKLNKAVTTAGQSAQNAAISAHDAMLMAQDAIFAYTKAKESQRAIENLSVSAESVDPEKDATVEKNVSADGSVALELSLPRGKSGVYVGDGDMPDGYNVQIDPSGDPAAICTGTDDDGNACAVQVGEVLVARGAGNGSLVMVVSGTNIQPKANGMCGFGLGSGTEASGAWSLSGGYMCKSLREGCFTFGNNLLAQGKYTAGFGINNGMYGYGSFGAGNNNQAGIPNMDVSKMMAAIALGWLCACYGAGSLAGGYNSGVAIELFNEDGTPKTDANGYKLFDPVNSNPDDLKGALSVGWKCVSSANGARSNGVKTRALGIGSSTDGGYTEARKKYSHAGGLGTIAEAENQTVICQYNDPSETALFIVGCGTDDEHRANAFMVDLDADGNPVYDFGGARFTPAMMEKLAAMLA